MVVALGLIGVLANVSAVERFWAIAKQVRVREADVAEARRRVANTVLIDADDLGEEAAHEPVVR
jgi:hypothetical protein